MKVLIIGKIKWMEELEKIVDIKRKLKTSMKIRFHHRRYLCISYILFFIYFNSNTKYKLVRE